MLRPKRPVDGRIHIQVLDEPLHDAEVVHHLHECNEENDGSQLSVVRSMSVSSTRPKIGITHSVDEEPVLSGGLGVEEESRASIGLLQEIGGKVGDEAEHRESSTGLEDEEGDDLLEEQANDDSGPNVTDVSEHGRTVATGGDIPWDMCTVLGEHPETKLEDEETKNVDSAVTISGSLEIWVSQRGQKEIHRSNVRSPKAYQRQFRRQWQEDMPTQWQV